MKDALQPLGNIPFAWNSARNRRTSGLSIKNFVPHCPEALRYAKVWGRDVVRSLTLAYAKRLFSDSNP